MGTLSKGEPGKPRVASLPSTDQLRIVGSLVNLVEPTPTIGLMGLAGGGHRVRYVLVIGAVVVLAACGSSETAGSDPSVVPEASSTTASSSMSATARTITTTSGGEVEPHEGVPDLGVLIATIEAAMKGTSYEGAALEEPEVFVATAQLFCEMLDQGMTGDQVLGEYLDRLSDGGAAGASDEEVRLAGVLLGVSVEVICPEHGDAL